MPIFFHIVAKIIIFNIVISRVTGSNVTKFLNNTEKLLPFNLVKSELEYSNPYRNASTMNEGMSPILQILSLKLRSLKRRCHGHIS